MFLGRWLLTLGLGLCLVLVGAAIAVLHHDGRAARGAILLPSLAGCHDSSFLGSPNCSRSSGLFPTILSYTPIIPSLSVSRNSGWAAHYVDPAGASRVSGGLIGIVRAGVHSRDAEVAEFTLESWALSVGRSCAVSAVGIGLTPLLLNPCAIHVAGIHSRPVPLVAPGPGARITPTSGLFPSSSVGSRALAQLAYATASNQRSPTTGWSSWFHRGICLYQSHVHCHSVMAGVVQNGGA